MNGISVRTISFGCGIVWKKVGFLSKKLFKYFLEVSDFEKIGLSWFEVGKHDFTLEYDRSWNA